MAFSPANQVKLLVLMHQNDNVSNRDVKKLPSWSVFWGLWNSRWESFLTWPPFLALPSSPYFVPQKMPLTLTSQALPDQPDHQRCAAHALGGRREAEGFEAVRFGLGKHNGDKVCRRLPCLSFLCRKRTTNF